MDKSDANPEETAEWSESLDALVAAQGHGRGREIMLSLLKRSKELHLGVPMVPTTDYINTIAAENEPEFPGDEDIERRYRAWIRWNAAVLVHRSQPASPSAATSPPTRHPLHSTRSATTTSSGARTTRAVVTRSSSRATPPPAPTRAPSSRAA
jgi:hypothetical protein